MYRFHGMVCLLLLHVLAHAQQLKSPSGQLSVNLSIHKGGITWSVKAGKKMVMEPSAAGLLNIGPIHNIRTTKQYTIHERLPSRGNNASIVNHCRVYEIIAGSCKMDVSTELDQLK